MVFIAIVETKGNKQISFIYPFKTGNMKKPNHQCSKQKVAGEQVLQISSISTVHCAFLEACLILLIQMALLCNKIWFVT